MEIRAISRAVSVLKYIGQVATGVSLTEIAASVGLSKATTHRILHSLQSVGFVRCDPLNGHYFLGPLLLALAQRADPHESLKRLARPFLESLRDETQETVTLVTRDHDERFTIDVLLSPQELKVAPPVGSKRPIHAGAAGKALLALASDEELQALAARTGLPRLTRTTVTSLAELKREIAKVRNLGYARSVEEAVEGQAAVGIPIIVDERVVAGINICGPSSRITPRRAQVMVKRGMVAARQLAAELSVKDSASRTAGGRSKGDKPIPRAKSYGRRIVGIK